MVSTWVRCRKKKRMVLWPHQTHIPSQAGLVGPPCQAWTHSSIIFFQNSVTNPQPEQDIISPLEALTSCPHGVRKAKMESGGADLHTQDGVLPPLRSCVSWASDTNFLSLSLFL